MGSLVYNNMFRNGAGLSETITGGTGAVNLGGGSTTPPPTTPPPTTPPPSQNPPITQTGGATGFPNVNNSNFAYENVMGTNKPAPPVETPSDTSKELDKPTNTDFSKNQKYYILGFALFGIAAMYFLSKK